MSSTPTTSRADSERKRFRDFGFGAQGVATQLFGEDSSGNVLPVKVVDDGSGRGKLVTTTE